MLLPRQPGRKRIPIIVADANAMASRLVCTRLKKHSQFALIGRAATVGELLALLERRQASVALINASLQDGWLSGLSLFPQLRQKHPEVRLVLMLDHPEAELVLQAFRAGARGIFTCYESQFDALCKCITRVHSGQIWANTSQMECLVEALAEAHAARPASAGGLNLLSKREEEVVRQVAEGLSNHDIAQQLHLSDHTVKNHLFHIFDKLGVSNRVELVLYAVSHLKPLSAGPPRVGEDVDLPSAGKGLAARS